MTSAHWCLLGTAVHWFLPNLVKRKRKVNFCTNTNMNTHCVLHKYTLRNKYNQIWTRKPLKSNIYQDINQWKLNTGYSVPLITTANLKFWHWIKFILLKNYTIKNRDWDSGRRQNQTKTAWLQPGQGRGCFKHNINNKQCSCFESANRNISDQFLFFKWQKNLGDKIVGSWRKRSIAKAVLILVHLLKKKNIFWR